MRIDEGRIAEKIRFIKDNLALVEQLGAYSESEFTSDKVKFYAGVHALQISIEAMLDILTHIVSRLHLGAPTDDRATLDTARKHDLIGEDHLRRFIQMNKFRNKVVHGYLDVDAKQVYQTLRNDLGDFQLFFDDIRRVIEQERSKEKNGKAKKVNGK
ncbi:MAG: DUF86 domain-containing protein [Chloroflexi bacterium]|nr:DUF86 domain-containing protein [Chloroflexota bacterium]